MQNSIGNIIGRATIFVTFVLIMKGTVLENFIDMLLRNVLILDFRPYLILFSAIMSESDLKQQTIYNFVRTFMAKSLGPPGKKWTFSVFVLTSCIRLTYSSASLLHHFCLLTKGMNTISYMVFTCVTVCCWYAWAWRIKFAENLVKNRHLRKFSAIK